MQAKGEITLYGFDTLYKALDDMEAKLSKKIARQALRFAAKELAKEIEARLPEDSGAYAASVKVKAGKQKKGLVSIEVHIASEDIKYALAVEFGSKYQAAQPEIRGTTAEMADQLIKKIIDDVAAGIEKAFASANWPTK